eukprot:13469297-Heterocapsa_arctica.AAC.1
MKVWRTYLRFWHAQGVCMTIKIILFRALVLSTLLSGLEAVVLGLTDIKRLERFQVRCLRILLHGQGRARTNDWVRERTKIAT